MLKRVLSVCLSFIKREFKPSGIGSKRKLHDKKGRRHSTVWTVFWTATLTTEKHTGVTERLHETDETWSRFGDFNTRHTELFWLFNKSIQTILWDLSKKGMIVVDSGGKTPKATRTTAAATTTTTKKRKQKQQKGHTQDLGWVTTNIMTASYLCSSPLHSKYIFQDLWRIPQNHV